MKYLGSSKNGCEYPPPTITRFDSDDDQDSCRSTVDQVKLVKLLQFPNRGKELHGRSEKPTLYSGTLQLPVCRKNIME